jgi:hypothetical protein
MSRVEDIQRVFGNRLTRRREGAKTLLRLVLIYPKGRSVNIFMAIHDATKTVLEGFTAKIHQQPKRQSQQSQICEQLLGMNRRQLLDRFQLNQEPPLNQQIDPETIVNDKIIKSYRNKLLTFNIQAAPDLSFRQDNFIYRFEQTRPKTTMDGQSLINGQGCKGFDVHLPSLALSRLRVT